MIELGLILIGTGLIVFFAGKSMIRSTRKIVKKSSYYNDKEDIDEQERAASKTEIEFTDMVGKSMMILYIVGVTCILLGIVFIVFS